MTGSRIDAVIVHYGDPGLTAAAAGRLAKSNLASLRVVDNSANLATLPPFATLVRPPTNLGFGRAVNLAAGEGRAPWLLVLNPDVSLDPGALEALYRAGEARARLGVVAPALRHPDGTAQINGGRFSGWVRELARVCRIGARVRALRARARPEAHHRGAGVIERDWASGAALLVRRAAFEQVGGFDEDFFLYYEDEDLCRRLRRRGWRVALAPAAGAQHAVGGCSGLEDPYRSAHFEVSRRLYHERYSGVLLRRLIGWHAGRREVACAEETAP
jgi:GT2 family glycosyltransferase